MSDIRRIDYAKIIEVIEVKALKGSGTANDPCRTITQYWSFDGDLLAEYDPEIKIGGRGFRQQVAKN